MGLGALAFAPFGPGFVTVGVLAGLYSVSFLGLVTILMGARGVAIHAPHSLVSFMIASVSADLFLGAAWLPPGNPDALLAAIFLLLALSGAFQLAFGLGHLATLVKFIPAPVMAGFQNAASIAVMLSQVPILLGLANRPALADWPAALADFRPLALVVGAVTLVVIYQAPRFTRRAPPLVLGLAAGTLLHHAFAVGGLDALLGATFGAIPIRLPDARELASIMLLATTPGFREALPAILLGAASIALVASLEVLISAKIVENFTRRRGDAKQVLVSMGTANLVTPLLGGVPGSIGLATTATAMKAGAHNSLAPLVHSVAFLAFVPLLAPFIGHLPRAVIAALVFHVGLQLFDRWTLRLAVRAATRSAIHWSGIVIDLGVIALVACVALAGEVVAAVLLGVAVAGVVFTLRMGRSVIRRERHGDAMQSRRARAEADTALLTARGRCILALELEGPLFFASAEHLQNRVDAAMAEGVRYVVLDVARVTELDSTGARILLQADAQLGTAGSRIVLCGADSRPELSALLADHGVTDALTRERLFPDLDRALEWCENDLLVSLRGVVTASAEDPFEAMGLLRDVEPATREALRPAFDRLAYRAGEAVFHQGEEGSALYVIAQGSASVWLHDRAVRVRRLVTFSPGTYFGEMAFLDRERRSATVIADEPLVCYRLERASFDRLAEAHPRAGRALLATLARELSLRLRRNHRSLLELD